ncbi:hypothetical protein P154DRAFT_560081 [Amniculicola lignicola CBS 123094]|uniref:C2H2-type domain-containing protein n=1 Tax=Amniculicola lignicola CBS 123094 TaxID=1392246 RepID=A0A6A5WVI3_9PLEO|nr:hypothetical protein P154DRAFT_560081 [Amniculicola lignicola CBS 123094]
MADSWEKAHYTSLTLWDIDREFQQCNEAYEQWSARNQRKRSRWECLGVKHQDDAIGRALSLGRRVQEIVDLGIDVFGTKFERGDSICHAILASQLLRIHHEISVPLLDYALARGPTILPTSEILMAAKGIRRTVLQALQDQYERLRTPTITPFLPPPRFSVNLCPYALQLKKDRKSKFPTKKLHPNDPHDDREICPYCNAHISITPHSGLPNYRRLLFQSHTICGPNNRSTFTCTTCYKAFDDSYGFLDHIFQKEIRSERSCLKRWSSQVNLNQIFLSLESSPEVVTKCLKNCLRRELTRIRAVNKARVDEGAERAVKAKEMERMLRRGREGEGCVRRDSGKAF